MRSTTRCASETLLSSPRTNWSVMARSSIARTSWLSGSVLRMSRQMLSASCGSLSSRYPSAFAMALGIALSLNGLSSNMTAPFSARGAEDAEQAPQRIVHLVHHPLLQRDDGVVGDGNAFRAHARAALGDVAEPHSLRLLQLADAVFHVERVHLQRGDVHEEARAGEPVVHLVLAQHVAN